MLAHLIATLMAMVRDMRQNADISFYGGAYSAFADTDFEVKVAFTTALKFRIFIAGYVS